LRGLKRNRQKKKEGSNKLSPSARILSGSSLDFLEKVGAFPWPIKEDYSTPRRAVSNIDTPTLWLSTSSLDPVFLLHSPETQILQQSFPKVRPGIGTLRTPCFLLIPLTSCRFGRVFPKKFDSLGESFEGEGSIGGNRWLLVGLGVLG